MATKFVDKSAAGAGTGASWANAWTEMNQITGLAAGDVVEIAGRTYTTQLTVASGSAGSPIRYVRSAEPGRNGRWTINGGRTVLLPYAGQAAFTDDVVLAQGISIPSGAAYFIIDGGACGGLLVTGAQHAVRMDGSCNNFVIRGLEADNCGTFTGAGPYSPDGKAIQTAGDSILLDHCLLHDSGQDLMQNDFNAGLNSALVRLSAFYNTREHPSYGGLGFSDPTHSDCLQIFNSDVSSGGAHPHGPITFLCTVHGPGVSQGFVGGDFGNSAQVNDPTFYGALFLNCPNHNGPILNFTAGNNYRLERCTHILPPQRSAGQYDPSYVPNWRHMSLTAGTGHVVKDCILQKGRTFTSGGALATNTGNVTDTVTNQGGTAIAGTAADPDFRTDTDVWTSTQSIASVLAGDYTARAAAAAGKGALVTSHAQLRRVGKLLHALHATRPSSLWTLADPPGRTTAFDDIRARDGTISGAVTAGAASLLRDDPLPALQLTQSDAQQIALGDAYHFAGVLPFSFGLVFRWDDTAPTAGLSHRLIYAGYTDGSGEQGWTVYLDTTTKQIKMRRLLNGAGATFTTTTALVNGAGAPTYAAFLTYDGTTMRGYLNGRPDGAGVASASSILDAARTTYLFSSGFSNSRPKLTAQMVGMWARALTGTEIDKLSRLARVGDRTGQDGMLGMAA